VIDIRRPQTNLPLALLAVGVAVGYGQSVSLTNASMQAQVLPAQTAAIDIPIQIEESPLGGGNIYVTTDDPGVRVSLVYPNGTIVVENPTPFFQPNDVAVPVWSAFGADARFDSQPQLKGNHANVANPFVARSALDLVRRYPLAFR
jgi:hypothetical protein